MSQHASAAPALRFRKAAAADVEQCLALLCPALRLEAGIRERLPKLWPALFEQGLSIALEDIERPGCLEAFCLSVLVEPAISERLLAEPRPYLPASFYGLLSTDANVLLAPSRIHRANANGGVDVLLLHFGVRSFDLRSVRTRRALAIGGAGLHFTHNGYNVRTLMTEVYGPAAAELVAQSGLRLVRDFGAELGSAPAADVPYLFALHRDWLQPSVMSPLGQLFGPPPPRIGYSDAERRVLEMALLNESDGRIAAVLGVSVDAVKKNWRRIFARTRSALPQLIPREIEAVAGARGVEKRRYVLEYVRTHLEELRPYGTEKL